ncbi:MAG: DUF1273 family protein [Eubacterium sp.]|nr:DUF1273 family protein [Eubacterium sp.]
MVIKLREKYPHIQLHMLLPCSKDKQTAGWWSCEKEHYYRIINHADSVEYVSDRYRIGCIKKRNARLIELASIYVCYYDEDRTGGRTEHIMRMVRRNGLHIFNHM